MPTLKDRYRDTILPPNRGPRSRAGYSLWQRYWASLTGAPLAPRSAATKTAVTHLDHESERAPAQRASASPATKHANRILVPASGPARAWGMRSRMALTAGAAVIVVALATVFGLQSVTMHTHPVGQPPPTGFPTPGSPPTYATPTPSQLPAPTQRDIVVRPTDGKMGIDLATGTVTPAAAGDIVYYFSGTASSTIFSGLGHLADLRAGRPADPRQACVEALRQASLDQISDLHVGRSFCVRAADGYFAFLEQTKPIGHDGTLYLHEMTWHY